MKKTIYYVLLTILILPLFFLIIYSFTYNSEWPSLVINRLRFDALKYWIEFNYSSTMLYSIFLSIVVCFITLLISFPAAKVLAHYNFKYNNLFRIIFLIPFIIPITTISIGVYYQFLVFGLAGNNTGIIIIHTLSTAPYAIIILERAIRKNSLKKEIIAKQLGASKLKTLFYITIPQNINAIISTVFISYTISFSQYFTTFIIGQGKIKTYAMEMYPYILDNNRHYGSMFNLVFMISIIVVLSIIAYFIRVLIKKLNYKIEGNL